MSNGALTRVHSLRERLDETLLAHRNDSLSLLSRIEGKGKGILQNHQIIAEFEAIPEHNRKILADGAFAEVLRATQEAIVLPPWVALAVRPRPGVWEYIRVNVHALVVEELLVAEYLHFKEELVDGGSNGNFVLELDFEPFNASFPRPTLSKSIGNGVEFLNRHLSVKLFHNKESMHPLLEFLRVHCHKGKNMMLNDRTENQNSLQHVLRLALATCRCPFYYIRCAQAQVHSIASRVRKTLRGSSDDIGWLQRTPGMAPVEDGTARFLELLKAIRNGDHTLDNSFVYLLIPGLFSNHGPLYFVATERFFSEKGLACYIAKIHSEASVEHNARELKEYIEKLYRESGKRVMLLGHSKGGVDAAAALSIYWYDLKGKVAGLALVQSPYGGNPIASDILRIGQIADKETRKITELIFCKLIKGDIRALEDLTYDKRKEFIMSHKLPEEIPIISFHSEASVAPGVLATMTHIAHARRVPVVIPLSAAMAVSALHLLLRYGKKSDGVVTCCDAEVPGSVVVRPNRKLDHTQMVFASSKKNPTEADVCEMFEALLTMLVQLGN